MEGNTKVHNINEFFFGSVEYCVVLFLPLIIFVVLLILFRKRAMDMADVVKTRGKMANKVATWSLRKANKLIMASKANEFYDEVLRALWGYVGDKLNIPVEKLSRDNISDNLKDSDVDDNTIDKFINAIDECEFE